MGVADVSATVTLKSDAQLLATSEKVITLWVSDRSRGGKEPPNECAGSGH